MKTQVTTCLALALLFLLTAVPAFPQGAQADLPDAARAYIQEHFPNERIASVMRDDDTMGFDVILSGGTEIDFDRQGEVLEVDGKTAALPDSVVPGDILSHVRTQHVGLQVKEIEKEPYGYEVTLTNGKELHFDKDGNLLRPRRPAPAQ